jgi:hypothetical protein
MFGPFGSHRRYGIATCFGSLALLLIAICGEVRGDDPVEIALSLHPARIDNVAPPQRLLPADPDLKPGNAAVVLLRMPWEQQSWMQEWQPKITEVSQLPPDDPRVAEFPFNRFAGEMRRAAFMRDADWNYPLEDEPAASILLPDAQGLRSFISRGMPIWINQRIAAGDLDAAREGVLTMLACSRHVGRTRLFVPQLVATAMAGAALDRTECLISQAHCPNLHGSLALLPDTIGDCQAAMQMEAQMIERSLPTLRGGVPASGNAKGWTAVMDEYLQLETDSAGGSGFLIPNLETLRLRLAGAARAAVARGAFAPPEGPISDDELAMSYILAKNASAHRRAEAALRLPPPDAIRTLADIEAEDNAVSPRESKPWASFLRMYLANAGFGRRVRMLEVVEALRDAAARNGGRFPASLAEVPARVPLDPFTGKPFRYEPAADGRSARLATTAIPGIDEPYLVRIYELTIATE